MNTKLIKFDYWCPLCKYEKLDGTDDPCNECLDTGGREDSTKPVCWKKKGE